MLPDVSPSASCECGAARQTAHNIASECPLHSCSEDLVTLNTAARNCLRDLQCTAWNNDHPSIKHKKEKNVVLVVSGIMRAYIRRIQQCLPISSPEPGNQHPLYRVTWDMTAPGGKTVPPPVDNLKLPRTFTEYTECCYHLPDSCFERSTPRSRRTLKYSIFNIYTFFDVIFPHHYTCNSSLYISDTKERNISCEHMITIPITTMV